MNLDLLSSTILNPRAANRGFRSSRPFLDHHRGRGRGDISSVIGQRLGSGLPFPVDMDFASQQAPVPPVTPLETGKQRLPGERGYWGMLGEAMSTHGKSFWDVKREHEARRSAAEGRNATIEAFREQGVPENWIKAAEHNPKVMDILIQQSFAKKDDEGEFTGYLSSSSNAFFPGGPEGAPLPDIPVIKMLQEAQIPEPHIRAGLEDKKVMNLLIKRALNTKTPVVKKFTDPNTGGEYQAQFNYQTGQWDKIGGIKGGGANFDDEGKLRKEWDALQGTKEYGKQLTAYKRIRDSAKDPSAAGDLAMIFNYMKLLDPGSVVRESEFATAQNAAGVPQRIRNVWNQLKAGERLAPEQRMDFVDRADRLYQGAAELQKARNDKYRKLAKDYGLEPTRIVTPIHEFEPMGTASTDEMVQTIMQEADQFSDYDHIDELIDPDGKMLRDNVDLHPDEKRERLKQIDRQTLKKLYEQAKKGLAAKPGTAMVPAQRSESDILKQYGIDQ
jgi:hypothetical protein